MTEKTWAKARVLTEGCSACVEACCGSGHWASAVMEGSVVLHQSA